MINLSQMTCKVLRFYRIVYQLCDRVSGAPGLGSQDYYDWDVVTMEVVSTAPLDGGCAAVRIRTGSAHDGG